jgi:hypothetical protein
MILPKEKLLNNNDNIDYIIFNNNTIDNIKDPDITLDMYNITVPYDDNITLNVNTSTQKISIIGIYIINKYIDNDNKIYYKIENKIHKIFNKK